MAIGNTPAIGKTPADQASRVPAPQNSGTNQGGGASEERQVSLGATERTSPVADLSGTGEVVAASSAAAQKTDVIPTEEVDQA